MDLNFNHEYCVYVTVLIRYNHKYIFLKDLKPVQGILQYQERIETCVQRLVFTEFNKTIEVLEFVGLGETFETGSCHTHNFILIAELNSFNESDNYHILEQEACPAEWLPMIEADAFDFYEQRTVEPSEFEAKDICYHVQDNHEFEIRINAIIQSEKGILFDQNHHLIGGRQKLNETIYQALEREVKEETSYLVLDSEFVGIAEDIIELKKYDKTVHFINLVFDVVVDMSEYPESNHETNQWIAEDKLSQFEMEMTEVKEMLLNL